MKWYRTRKSCEVWYHTSTNQSPCFPSCLPDVFSLFLFRSPTFFLSVSLSRWRHDTGPLFWWNHRNATHTNTHSLYFQQCTALVVCCLLVSVLLRSSVNHFSPSSTSTETARWFYTRSLSLFFLRRSQRRSPHELRWIVHVRLCVAVVVVLGTEIGELLTGFNERLSHRHGAFDHGVCREKKNFTPAAVSVLCRESR